VTAERAPLTKSQQMARVRSTNTRPEVSLRHTLWRLGFRYRIHSALPGSPDIVLSRYRMAIFVDGCFWHGCPDHYRAPVANRGFWDAKLVRNVERDARANAVLSSMGWRVVRIWEHDIRQNLEGVCDGLCVELRVRSEAP
jgi:DNA mismatch endonuclease (patch repair protein)